MGEICWGSTIGLKILIIVVTKHYLGFKIFSSLKIIMKRLCIQLNMLDPNKIKLAKSRKSIYNLN